MTQDRIYAFVEENMKTIFAYACSRVPHKQEAEDLAGDIIAALLAAAEKTSGKTFLFWNTLNSRPSPDGLETIDYRTLPTGFHSYFETPVQPLDR